jgi:hypothetical protein
LMNSCIVCPSSTHIYWWTLVLSVRLLLTYIDELLYCLSVFYSRILMNYCIVCPSSTHEYWWTLWCLSVFYSRILMNSCIVCPSSTHGYWWTLVLSVRLLLKDIDYLFGVFKLFIHVKFVLGISFVLLIFDMGLDIIVKRI